MFQTYEQDIRGVPKEMDMNTPDKRKFHESDKPADQHKYNGWYWHYETKKFYRWDDLPRENS